MQVVLCSFFFVRVVFVQVILWRRFCAGGSCAGDFAR